MKRWNLQPTGFYNFKTLVKNYQLFEVNVSATDALAFLRSTGKPFVSNLKANISSRFVSQDIVSAFSILDPKKVPSVTSPDIKTYGEAFLNKLIAHFGVAKNAITLAGLECDKEAIVSDEAITEWKNYGRYLAQNNHSKSVARIKNHRTDGCYVPKP